MATTRESEDREEAPHDLHFGFRSGEEGQDMAEYAILIGLLSIVAVVALSLIGIDLRDTIQAVGDALAVLP